MSDTSTPAGGGAPAQPERPAARLHKIDTIVALIILVCAALLFYETTKFGSVSSMLVENIGPATFPRILLIFIAVLTLTIPFEHLYIGGAKRLDKNRTEPVVPITWATMAVIFVCTALMPYVGTVMYMVLVCIALPVLWGEYRIRVLAPFAILFPALITLIFSGILKVHFIPGLLAFLEK